VGRGRIPRRRRIQDDRWRALRGDVLGGGLPRPLDASVRIRDIDLYGAKEPTKLMHPSNVKDLTAPDRELGEASLTFVPSGDGPAERCLSYQSSHGFCATDESDQRFPGSWWYSGPVAADLAKQSVL
jgi:hypothetical protein